MGTVCAGVAALALALAPGAGAKPGSFTELSFQGRATNGYAYELTATKTDGRDRTVSLELSRGDASVLYISRHPRRFDRRNLVARFGDLGRVSLHLDRGGKDGLRGRCFRYSVGYGRFNGAIRFDGESLFARVRDERPFGFFERMQRTCGKGRPNPMRASRDSVVSSCTDRGKTGFFAAEEDPRSPVLFLLSRFERTPDLFIFRSLFVEGAARSLKVAPDRRSAKVRPPESFYGRAEVSDGEMTGRIRAALPGAGLVRLAPAPARITTTRRFFETSECLPLALLRRAGSDNAERFARTLR